MSLNGKTPFRWLNPLTTLQRIWALYTHFKLNCGCNPRVSELKMLLPPCYLQEDFKFMIPSTCYCRSSTYQEGAGVQESYTNATRELRSFSYYQPSSHCNSNPYSPTSVVGSPPFRIWNHTGIGAPHEALRLRKGIRDTTSLGWCHKHCALGTSVTRPRCMARWTQRRPALWCLFDSSTREAGSTDVALGHSPSEATSEGLGEEEALLDCWDVSWIRGFGDARHQGYGKTRWHNPSSKT